MIRSMTFKLDDVLVKGAQEALGTDTMTDAVSLLCKRAIENKEAKDALGNGNGTMTSEDWDMS